MLYLVGSLTKYTISDQQKALYMDRTFGLQLRWEILVHNSAVCKATAWTDASGGGGTANDVTLLGVTVKYSWSIG